MVDRASAHRATYARTRTCAPIAQRLHPAVRCGITVANMFHRRLRYALVIVFSSALFSAAAGCAHYEYDVIRPEGMAGHVGNKQADIFTLDPLEYQLQTVDNRLVMLVYNHTDQAVQLIGGKSYVVSPNGESHPLRNVPIAPGSFIKLILPPLRPHAEHAGPSIGFGIGASSGGYHHSGVGVGVGTGVGGHDYYVEDNGQEYWEWNDESDVRLNMTYEQNDHTFSHEFLLHRKKM